MQVINWDQQALKQIERFSGYEVDKDLMKKVSHILHEVKTHGDQALLRFTRQFDGINLPMKKIAVSEADINRAYERIKFEFVPLLKQVKDNVTAYYQSELRESFSSEGPAGIYLGKQYRPIERVGIYIPGGTAPLVSTVYMTVLPAKTAGGKEIAIATPPNHETGDIDPHIFLNPRPARGNENLFFENQERPPASSEKKRRARRLSTVKYAPVFRSRAYFQEL